MTTTEITYRTENGYRLPNLLPPQEPEIHLGKYALLRRKFLKQQRRVTYTNLLTSGRLNQHLMEVEQTALSRMKQITSEMAKSLEVTEELKARDQMYTAKDMNMEEKHAAVIIGPPYGGVKEQGPGIYAQELAKRGFVALAFDPSFNGYSGGMPRRISSPDFFVEDFSAAVDFVGTRPFVDREKIGAIGICGSGGFALSAAPLLLR